MHCCDAHVITPCRWSIRRTLSDSAKAKHLCKALRGLSINETVPGRDEGTPQRLQDILSLSQQDAEDSLAWLTQLACEHSRDQAESAAEAVDRYLWNAARLAEIFDVWRPDAAEPSSRGSPDVHAGKQSAAGPGRPDTSLGPRPEARPTQEVKGSDAGPMACLLRRFEAEGGSYWLEEDEAGRVEQQQATEEAVRGWRSQALARVLEGLREAFTVEAIADCRQAWDEAAPAAAQSSELADGDGGAAEAATLGRPFEPRRRALVAPGVFRVELDEGESMPQPIDGPIVL